MASPARAAAFFDIDGTLLPPPSLERRLFRQLRYRHAILSKSYALWLAQALRLAPCGFDEIRHANKMYLRGVRAGDVDQKIAQSFFPRALERVAWHVAQGHAIVLVSGTLEPLAQQAARAIEAWLFARGCKTAIHVCATQLEVCDGFWTGHILGDAMHGEAKAGAALRIAQSERLLLANSYAYGDSASDRYLLDVVGQPAAVHPSPQLARFAARRGWPVISWEVNKESEHDALPSFSTQSDAKRGIAAEDRWEEIA